MKLNILSPERKLLEDLQVSEVTLPSSEGEIQILPGHAAFMGILTPGILSYQAPAQPVVRAVVSSGFFQVEGDTLNVMAETIELSQEIDLNRARKAQELAEKTLQDAQLDEASFKKYQLKLQKSLARQDLVERP